MIGFEKITAPFPAVEMNSFRNNRAVGELNQQLFDRFVLIFFVKILIKNFVFLILRTGAVIEVGNPRQIYMFNTFDDWDSRYEMRTRARLLYEDKKKKNYF
jgi:hypothetical protein